MSHEWWESSGTTSTCEHCGCVRYSELRDGTPVSNRRAQRYVYGRKGKPSDWSKAIKTQPECLAPAEVRP